MGFDSSHLSSISSYIKEPQYVEETDFRNNWIVLTPKGKPEENHVSLKCGYCEKIFGVPIDYVNNENLLTDGYVKCPECEHKKSSLTIKYKIPSFIDLDENELPDLRVWDNIFRGTKYDEYK